MSHFLFFMTNVEYFSDDHLPLLFSYTSKDRHLDAADHDCFSKHVESLKGYRRYLLQIRFFLKFFPVSKLLHWFISRNESTSFISGRANLK